MKFIDCFKYEKFKLSILQDEEIDETVGLINPAYSYQEQAKGAPRTNPKHLRKRANETDFYVVKDQGKIIGCVYLEPVEESLRFGLLTVASRYRKTGLAPALMAAIEKYAIENHFNSLELDYMSLAPWLKRYYERYGFTETGKVTNWGSIDLVRMEKQLIS